MRVDSVVVEESFVPDTDSRSLVTGRTFPGAAGRDQTDASRLSVAINFKKCPSHQLPFIQVSLSKSLLKSVDKRFNGQTIIQIFKHGPIHLHHLQELRHPGQRAERPGPAISPPNPPNHPQSNLNQPNPTVSLTTNLLRSNHNILLLRKLAQTHQDLCYPQRRKLSILLMPRVYALDPLYSYNRSSARLRLRWALGTAVREAEVVRRRVLDDLSP